MKRLNSKIILSNISEAREELQRIEEIISKNKNIDEIDFEIRLRHAYHHLNTAWNTRRLETKKYANMTYEQFHEWGLFPPGMDDVVGNDDN